MNKKELIEEKILSVDFSDEFKKSYIDYSMSVITARAIPDARDGLKPVQRRILYDMNELHVDYNGPTRKSARIVGDTMGKYHPHGDSSIYDAMVVMSQDFKKGIPLVDGQGNFGSIEGDGAAAERYTEARLSKFTQDVILADMKQTVPFVPNYDGTEMEPDVLPARLPLFLINGSEGIAVGMTTSTPTHNISEVCDLCKAYVDNPKMNIDKMMEYLPGPDFPTGGIVSNRKDLKEIYKTGTGKIKIRGRVVFEKAANKKDHDKLVITEIPYTMIGSGIEKFMSDVAQLVEDKKLPDIVDISNQSNKEGIRIVLDLKNGSDYQYIENVLYKKTKLEDTFGVNMLAIDKKKPEILSLSSVLSIWYEFQKEILTKKYSALLTKCEEKREIQEGLIKACDCIDLIIEVIRGSRTGADAKACLTKGDTSKITFKTKISKTKAAKLAFTDAQADAILKLELQRLIGLEIEMLMKSYKNNLSLIEEYKAILSDTKKLNAAIIKDITAFKKDFAESRKTSLEDCEEIQIVEKKEAIDCYLLVDRFRYCKLIDTSTYERNLETISEQYIHCIKTNSEDKILLFTDTGFAHQIKCSSIPMRKYKEKGEPLENLSTFKQDEDMIYLASDMELINKDADNPNPTEKSDKKLLFATKKGFVKFVSASEFASNKKTIQSTKLSEEDRIVSIIPYNDEKYCVMSSSSGYLLKFDTSEIPLQKKTSIGVKGMTLKDSDLSYCSLCNADDTIQIDKQTFQISKIKTTKKGSIGTKSRKL